MKKLFAILMSIMMIACFMPTMAFAGGTATQNIKLGEAEQTLTMLEKTYGETIEDIPISVTTTGNGSVSNGGTLSATVDIEGANVIDASIVESKLKLSIKKAGSATVTVKAEGTENYAAGTAELTVTVAPKELTAIKTDGVTVTKVYDGNTTKGEVGGKAITFDGIVGRDEVSINAEAGAYADQYVGNNKTVTLTLALDGAAKDNYTLGEGGDTTTINTASITAATQTITGSPAALKVGNTLDLSKTFTSDAGAKLTFTVAENSNKYVELDKDEKTLKGLAKGDATIKVTAATVDVNKDGKPEYKALADGTVTVNVSEKNSISGKITFGDQNVTYGDDYTPNAATFGNWCRRRQWKMDL